MITTNDNKSTTQSSAADTKVPVTNAPSPDATTNNKAGQPLPGAPTADKHEAPTTDDRKDGKNNAPGSVPDPARTTSGNDRHATNTGTDTKTPQGSNS